MADTGETQNVTGFNDPESFLNWLWTQQERLSRLETELNEAQAAFTDRFVDVQQRLDDAEYALLVAVDTEPEAAIQIHDWLQENIDAQREKLLTQRDILRAQVDELILAIQKIETDCSQGRQVLTETNPALNEREEELELQINNFQAQVHKLDIKLEELGNGMGWIWHAREIHEIREQRDKAATEAYATVSRLNEVRLAWKTQLQQSGEQETGLQVQWQQKTALLANIQAQLDPLERDLVAACRRALITDFVAQQPDLEEPITSETLNNALTQAQEWYQKSADLKEGLAALAQCIGLVGGLKQGFGNLATSVDGVRKEQDMHATLARLQFEAPVAALEYNDDVWDELIPIIKDEKQSAQTPRPVAEAILRELGDRTKPEVIEGMFGSLAACMETAIKTQWG